MKKFFSLCVLAVSALFGLTCCSGGGNGSDADYMSINDFARGGKKIRCGYQLQLDIVPFGTDGNMSDVTALEATMIPGEFIAGGDEIGANFTYSMAVPDARQATLWFQLTEDVDQLSNRNLMAGLGFQVSDIEGGDNVQTGMNAQSSLSGISCTLTFDFDSKRMRATSSYQIREVIDNEKGTTYGPIILHETPHADVPFVVGF
ncbi:MAG: hypothetical protein IKV82_08205 [Akkermansia sp.]|nr:hypothetical protein [Akkermansia sp.]